MKRFVFILMGFIILSAVLPSCSKRAYPHDPYRGSSGYHGSIKSKPAKSKATYKDRHVPVRVKP